MEAKTLKALKESIAHWSRLASGKRLPQEEIGIKDCALCNLFFNRGRCCGCPVMEKTGLQMCYDTPYEEASVAHGETSLDSLRFKRAARAELRFLRSLLPKTKPTK